MPFVTHVPPALMAAFSLKLQSISIILSPARWYDGILFNTAPSGFSILVLI